jgi:hypothetical protein
MVDVGGRCSCSRSTCDAHVDGDEHAADIIVQLMLEPVIVDS